MPGRALGRLPPPQGPARGALGQAPQRLEGLTEDNWLISHCVHLPTEHSLKGTILHNPRSNLNNGVGYANPARFSNPVALGTDGIGANMIESFRLAYVMHRSVDVTVGPDPAWAWLENGWRVMPEARQDEVTWSYEPMDPWHIAFTPGVRPLDVVVAGETVLKDGVATRVDPVEVRAKAAEHDIAGQLAVAAEQEMVAQIEESRAKLGEAEAEVPKAIAEAFSGGRLGGGRRWV